MAYYVSNGVISSGILLSYDSMYVSSGGTATNTTVNPYGSMYVAYGGTATDTTVSPGGNLYISSGGILSGTLQITSGAVVSASTGAMIDFTLSGRATSADALINDWSLIANQTNVSYSITVVADQAVGIYKLVENASTFINTILVKTDNSEALGELTVGSSFIANGFSYGLVLSDGCLSFTIAENAFASDPVGELTVTTLEDIVDAYDGVISIREAIANAIAADGDCKITFADDLSGTLVLDATGISISANTFIDRTLTIQGTDRIQFTNQSGTCSNTNLIFIQSDNQVILQDLDFYNVNGRNVYNMGSLTVEDCSFTDGTSDYGTNVWTAFGGITTIRNTTFTGNSTTNNAGAVRNESSTVIIDSCTFIENHANSYGGAIHNVFSGANMMITNTTFIDNSCGIGGGAIYNYNSAKLTVNNCIFSGNFAGSYGQSIHTFDSTLIVTNNECYESNYNGIVAFSTTISSFTFEENYFEVAWNQADTAVSQKISINGKITELSKAEYAAEDLDAGHYDIYVGNTDSFGNTAWSERKSFDVMVTYNDSVKVYSSGTLTSSGTLISGATLVSGGNDFMSVSSGGTATDTTVNSGGSMYVSSGGMVNHVEVIDYSARLIVSSGGTATNITANNGWIDFAVASDTYVQGTYAGSAFEMKDAMISGYTLHGYVDIYDGGIASDTMINARYTLSVSSGGMANNTIVDSAGSLQIYDGGIANDTTHLNAMISGGIRVFSGGIANRTIIDSEGRMYISHGGIVHDTLINEMGFLLVDNGGTANDTVINKWGSMHISSGGTALGTLVNQEGFLAVSSGGTATIAFNPWQGTIDSSAGANITYLDRDASIYYLMPDSTGTAAICNKTNMLSDQFLAHVRVYDGGIVDNSTLIHGLMHISSGGIANSMTITRTDFSGGIHIFDGGSASNTILDWGGRMVVSSGGISISTIVNTAGNMNIFYAGMAIDTTVNSGARLTITGRGKHAGSLTLESGAVVSAFAGAVIDFTLSGRDTSADALINNLSLISGAPSYTVTIGEEQGIGIYRLAEGAGNFAETITVKTTDDTTLGELNIDNSLENGEFIYTLTLVGEALNFSIEKKVIDITIPTITNITATPSGWTNQSVTVTVSFADETELASSQYSFDKINWYDYTTGVTVSENRTVYFKATDAAGNISTAEYTVSNIDKVAPNAPIASANVTTATNQSVTVSATFSNDSVKQEYSLDGQKWQSYISGVVMSANGTVYFKATDAAGNISTAEYMVSNIDKVAPVITLTGDNRTSLRYASLSAKVDDGSKLYYSMDNANWQEYTGTVKVNGNGTYYFRATDAAGNTGINSITFNNIRNVVKDDLDGNGFSDVILVHEAGFCGTWLTTGKSDVIKWGDLSQVNSGWSVFGTGKAYGSGGSESDIFVTNGSVMGAWTVEKGAVTGWKSIATFDTSTTEVLGLGDFNGDGATDVLLRSRSATGDLGCYLTDGTGWNYLIGLGSEWKIAGVGDLDGNGYDDVIIRHDIGFTGAYMISNGGKDIEWMNLDTLEDSTEILGCGDINGDGIEEVLIRKGEWIGAWFTGENGVDDWWGLTTLDSTTEVEQLGDFNHDGITDLRVRTDGGDVGVLYVNGEDRVTWQYFGGLGNEWTTGNTAQVC